MTSWRSLVIPVLVNSVNPSEYDDRYRSINIHVIMMTRITVWPAS